MIDWTEALQSIESNLPVVILLVAFSTFLLGWVLGGIKARRRNAVLEALLEREKSTVDEKAALVEHVVSNLAQDALLRNNDEFLKLARSALAHQQSQQTRDWAHREAQISDLIEPIAESLKRTEQQLRTLEKDRVDGQGQLRAQIASVVQSQQSLRDETRRLSTALRRPEVRGRWGELTLRRTVEISGLSEHCDYVEQPSVDKETGQRRRPDLIIRLPHGRTIVIDAKTPLDAYLDAIEAEDPDKQEEHLKHHARQTRAQVTALASKAYWDGFASSPEFVVLFIPGEQFLDAALRFDRDLMNYALDRKVIPATPATLVALLKSAEFGWRQTQLVENAGEIRDLGAALYDRIGVVVQHLTKLGASIETGVESYNKLLSAFNSQVTPAAKRLSALGIKGKKNVDSPTPVEAKPRSSN